MNHIPVLLEHIHLLDRLDGLHVQLLERGLQLLVVCAGGLVDFFHFSSRGAFASVKGGQWGKKRGEEMVS